jgi:acetyl esterase/lipase
VRRRLSTALVLLFLFSAASVDGAAAEFVTPNSGLAGSTCVPAPAPVPYTSPDAGVSTTSLGTDAPAYYEVGQPMGEFAGQSPKATMIVIHGGSWYTTGKEVVAATRRRADRWRKAGWRTINISYRACGQSIGDVLWFMQRVRDTNPSAVVCATGASAGGHLALMLAAKRSDLACAISYAGPSDLVRIAAQTTVDRQTGIPSSAGPARMSQLATAAFGNNATQLAYSSPLRYAGAVTARVLLATGASDFLVPSAQDANFGNAVRAARSDAYVDVMSLPKGSMRFVHSLVTPESLEALRAREDALVAPLLPATLPINILRLGLLGS